VTAAAGTSYQGRHGRTAHGTRAAVTSSQVEDWQLPSRPTKRTDSRAKSWGGGDLFVELDAIQPDTLRALVRNCIEQRMPLIELDRLRIVEAAERETLTEFISSWVEAAAE
jgi:hypothetical protein